MVTTAKRREIAPQAPGNVERLRKLYELSMTLSGDPAEVFARIAPMIGELLEVPIVCLSRIVGDELHFLSFYDRGKVVSNAGRYPLSVTPCATVEQTRDLRVYDRVAERFPDAAFLKKNNAVSYCGFPSLDNDGKVLAVTFLLDDRPHDFTPDDRDLLRVFGQRIGMEIERQKYLDERDRVVSALGEAEAKYRRIFENADEGIFQSTPEGRFISANPALARMLGFDSSDELMNGVANIGEQLFVDPEERTKFMADLASRGQFRGKEIQYRRKDGTVIWLSESVHAVRDGDGGVLYYQGTVTDITDRKHAEAALQASQARFAGILDIAQEAVVSVDEAQTIQIFNKGAERIFGYAAGEIVGRPLDRLMPARFRAAHGEHIHGFARAPEASRLMNRRGQIIGLRKDGTEFPAEASVSKLELGGQVTFTVMLRDITARKMTESALRDSEAQYRNLIEGSIQGVLIHRDRKPLFANQAYADIFGYDDPEEIVAAPSIQTFEAVSERERLHAYGAARLRRETAPTRYEFEGVRKDGSHVWLENFVTDVDWGGEPAVQSTTIDITDRKQAETALRDSEERIRDFAETASDWFWETDENLRFTYFSDRFGRSGLGSDERIGKTRADTTADDSDQPKWREHLADLKARRPFKHFEYSTKARDGTLVHVSTSGTPFFDAAGNFKGYRGTGADITERKRAEQALKENEERLSQAAKLAKLGHWVWDEKRNRVDRFSPELARIFGLGDDAEIDSFADFLAYVHRDDQHLVETVIQQARRDRSGFEVEYRIKARDGATRYVVERSEPVFDETGELVRSVSTIQDITEIKQAEERLRHAHKMEAIGQLTGGVAHDFNNLLAVILGHAELLEDRLGADDPSVRAVSRTALRGAELTQRLLAFSRRQSLQPEVMDLDALIAGMTELLRRTLGETIEIELTSETEPWQTLADPGQVESALLNLAINARDAMPGGGRLTIATDNVTLDDSGAARHADAGPGDYVRLTVTDTGTGMAAEVLERALEPFFTTKEVGEGSGLGLPMVYGFAKQSGGFVSIGSEVGRGTTVALYLPRAKVPERYAGNGREEAEPKGRGESILVIEDDPDMRHLATSMLDSLGYRVLAAESAKAALEMLDGADGIDLMLADVVLSGGMSGPCLADEVRHQHPDIKVLFMTGYAGKDIAEHGSPCKADGVLGKPFRKSHLAQTVRAVLDGKGRSA